jgi:hypothetical protein
VDERTHRLIALIESYFASDIPDNEKRQTANEMLKELAYYNRRVAENRGIGKESRLSPREWPLQIPLTIRRQIITGNEEAILQLLEESE